jgi:hypothetical protein
MVNIDIHAIITHPFVTGVSGFVFGIFLSIWKDRIRHYNNKRYIKNILKGELEKFIDNSENATIQDNETRFNEIALQMKGAIDIDKTCLTDHDINTAKEIAVEIEEVLKSRPTENDKILQYMAYATQTQEELTNQAEYCLKRLNQNIFDRLSRTHPPRDRKHYRPPLRPPLLL